MCSVSLRWCCVGGGEWSDEIEKGNFLVCVTCRIIMQINVAMTIQYVAITHIQSCILGIIYALHVFRYNYMTLYMHVQVYGS